MNTETKHTKGPWKTGKSSTTNAAVFDANNKLVSDCRDILSKKTATNIANARLIAAAPELLEVLEVCEGNVSSLLASTHPAVFGEWLKVIREAIAKAKGGEE